MGSACLIFMPPLIDVRTNGTAAELFPSRASLNEAIEAQLQAVRSAPLDSGRRTFLFELLSFAGQWDRADQAIGRDGSRDGGKRLGAPASFKILLAAEQIAAESIRWASSPRCFSRSSAVHHSAVAGPGAVGPRAAAAAAALLQHQTPPRRSSAERSTISRSSGLRDADDLLGRSWK